MDIHGTHNTQNMIYLINRSVQKQEYGKQRHQIYSTYQASYLCFVIKRFVLKSIDKIATRNHTRVRGTRMSEPMATTKHRFSIIVRYDRANQQISLPQFDMYTQANRQTNQKLWGIKQGRELCFTNQ